MAETSNKKDQHAVKHSMKELGWAAEVEEKLKNMDQSSTETSKRVETAIFQVPAYIKNRNPAAYSPQVLSLGPYHHGETHLKPMEEQKERALLRFLRRSGKRLQELYESLYKEVGDLKDSYDHLGDEWNKDQSKKFLELMIRDGCFMLEIFLAADKGFAHYSCRDPIFSRSGLLNSPYIKRDMLMIENQLPMRVLEILYAESGDDDGEILNAESGANDDEILLYAERGDDDDNTSNRVYRYIRTFFFGRVHSPLPRKYLHVLDMYRRSLVFRNSRDPTDFMRILSFLEDDEDFISFESRQNEADIKFEGLISSARRPKEAGIKFEGLNAGLGFGDKRVRFDNGVLKLPVINLDEGSESMFLNLTAFERVYKRTESTGMDVTSYILFMDNLIDNEKDVALLRSKGIIRNISVSDKAVAELFKSLSKDLMLPSDIRILKMRDDINKYCGKRWNKWRANLFRNYFSNPWVTLSVIAAFLIFTFTILQTTYTILPYHHK